MEEESNVIISSATKEKLPLGIQHILSEQDQPIQGFDRIDMWTPETESRYRKEMQSLCGKYQSM